MSMLTVACINILGTTPLHSADYNTPITKPLNDPNDYGIKLFPGDAFVSPDGRFRLAYQADGNLVLYQGQLALWDTNTTIGGKNGSKYGYSPQFVKFQRDGNLVVYHSFLQTPASLTAVWASNTSKNKGYSLSVQSDGNLVIYGSDGRAKWDTNTCCR